MQEHAGDVAELLVVDLGAVERVVGAVEGIELGVHEPNRRRPVERPLRPRRVRGVARVPREARREVEEAPVRDGVLVVVAGVEREDLPLEPAAARARREVPAGRLRVEDALREGQPREGVRVRRVREFLFSCLQRREPPEGLVVVAFRARLVARHEVAFVAGLVLQREGHRGVVRAIAGVGPVCDQGHHHGAGFPLAGVSAVVARKGGRTYPVIGVREVAGDAAGLVRVVPFHQTVRGRAGGVFDRF